MSEIPLTTTVCSHPLNRLWPDPRDKHGSICGACGQRINMRPPDRFYPVGAVVPPADPEEAP